MATREQVEQEAEELYPESYDAETGHHVDDWGFSECQREAHVRAKTITAEQVEEAAKALWRSVSRSEPNGSQWEYERDEYLDDSRAALRGAGFYVEGVDR